MPDTTAATKRRKQLAVIVTLTVGLVVAIMTQPAGSPSTTKLASVTPTAMSPSATAIPDAPDKGISVVETKRFAVRALSRIEWNEIRRLPLFKPRQIDSGSIMEPNPTGPIRVEAIYGSTIPRRRSPDQATTVHSQDASGVDRPSALIGQSIVRPGETLPDGRAILDVTTEGVAVAP